jgi:8-oxo-dGTP pyrophosphatase MutT (NUDIX family)
MGFTTDARGVCFDQEAGPFSPEGFAERARRKTHPLARAAWMATQPFTHGIDAGRAVDANGQAMRGSRLDETVAPDAWKNAAVLVPVIAREPEVTVLLTLRPAHLNAHAGQIAFPGGKIEADDATPVDAALREAKEEVGMPLSSVTPLGLLDPHRTGTGYRIFPVLALVENRFVPTLDPREVAEVFEVPLSFLMAEENHAEHVSDWQGRRVSFYAISYGTRFIWGATAAILRNLYERLHAP